MGLHLVLNRLSRHVPSFTPFHPHPHCTTLIASRYPSQTRKYSLNQLELLRDASEVSFRSPDDPEEVAKAKQKAREEGTASVFPDIKEVVKKKFD